MADPMNGAIRLENIEQSAQQRAFSAWGEAFGLDERELSVASEGNSRVERYDAVFLAGAKKFLINFRAQAGGILDIPAIQAELGDLRARGDLVGLGKKEEEITRHFQSVISSYGYESATHHPKNILESKKMNCVGASLIGGLLLKEVGITCVLAGAGSHVFLVVTTSDERVLWQDMQDGKEQPKLENGEITADAMVDVKPSDVISFSRQPTMGGLTFTVKKDFWKDKPVTLYPFMDGVEEMELVNTGFEFNRAGRYLEAKEVLEVAAEKYSGAADAHLGLAKALKGLGHYVESIAECRKVLEIDPNYAYVRDIEIPEIEKLAAQ